MWNTYYIALLAVPHLADALSLNKRDAPAVLQLDVKREPASHPVKSNYGLRGRDKTIDLALENSGIMYLTNITLGNPPQKVRLIIDTGSSDTWCNAVSSDLCSNHPKNCRMFGAYEANSSTSYKYLNSDFELQYVDGTAAAGDFVSDDLTIGGATVPGAQFGLAYSSTSMGVIGLGYVGNEAIKHSDQKNYPNVPQALVDHGFIKSKAYSLWLNDLDALSGTLLFGGVDSEKYVGDLQTVPILQLPDKNPQFYINMTGLALSVNGNVEKTYESTSLPIPAVLDSGTSYSTLPESIITSIFQDLNGTYDPDDTLGYLPCSLKNEDISLEFTFDSASVLVRVKEILTSSKPARTMADGTQGCALGLLPGDGSSVTLGDTFLRSVYVVYDLDNNEISLANTNLNASSGSGSVLEIGGTVPGATKVNNPSTTATSTVKTASGSTQRSATATTSTASEASSAFVPHRNKVVIFLCVVALFIMLRLL